jgi:hypothetical protein
VPGDLRAWSSPAAAAHPNVVAVSLGNFMVIHGQVDLGRGRREAS